MTNNHSSGLVHLPLWKNTCSYILSISPFMIIFMLSLPLQAEEDYLWLFSSRRSDLDVKTRKQISLLHVSWSIKDWVILPSSPTLLWDVTAVMRWILRKGLILGNALNQLSNHIPFSMLWRLQPSARTAFWLYLPKRFIRLDQHWIRSSWCWK